MNLWKLSAGTAAAIGKKQLKTDVLPTTAYVMLGEKCQNSCRFCAQSRDSSARSDMLSRVTWPEYPADDATAAIAAAYRSGRIKRACLQVVKGKESWQASIAALDSLTAKSQIPICISTDVTTATQARKLIERGAQCISIALDAATPAVYEKVKGGQWEKRWQLLVACAEELPGQVSTHLIAGLGETEEEMVGTMAACRKHGIHVALFAFTPVRGTAWEEKQPPAIGHYRRLQIAHYLLKQGYGVDIFQFAAGTLTGVKLPASLLTAVFADGKAFETTGCSGCNRPYYNERPGGVMYNYPRPLTPEEVSQALKEAGPLW